jgi:hypothetical protein
MRPSGVLDAGERLVGILSERNIVRAMAESSREGWRQHGRHNGQYLTIICRGSSGDSDLRQVAAASRKATRQKNNRYYTLRRQWHRKSGLLEFHI